MSSNLRSRGVAALTLFLVGVSGSPLFRDFSCPSSCIPKICDSNVQFITSYITVLPTELQTQILRRPNSIPPHSNGNQHDHLVTVVPIPAPTILSYNYPNGEFPHEQIHPTSLPMALLTTTEYQTATLTRTRTHYPSAYTSISSFNTQPTTVAPPSQSDNWASPEPLLASTKEPELIHTNTQTQTRSLEYGLGNNWDANSAMVTERPSSFNLPDDNNGGIDATYTITSADVTSGITEMHVATRIFRPHFHNSEPQFGPKAAYGPHVSTEIITQPSCTAPFIVYHTTTQTINILTVETAKPTEIDAWSSSNSVRTYEREKLTEHTGGHADSSAQNEAVDRSEEDVPSPSHERTLERAPSDVETLWKRWYKFGESPSSFEPTVSPHQKPQLGEPPVEEATAYHLR